MKKLLAVLFIAFSLCSCAQPAGTTTTLPAEYRWMDRTVYFAFSNATFPTRNNEFQKSKIKAALDEISKASSLGAGYFSYNEVDESLLQPSTALTSSGSDFKSFILIYPDDVFSDFVVNKLGGQVPDSNAVTVLNSAFKRKFYMIFKASCFVSSSACNSITTGTGLSALVARQLGLMTGLSTKDCTLYPNDVMCSTIPNDLQWAAANKQAWLASFNNVLEAILMNPSFYNEYVPPTN